MNLLVLAQAQAADNAPPPETSSSAAAVIFGVFALVAVISVVGIASKSGRRTILPLVAILLGASIVATTVSEASINSLSPITVLGLFFGAVIALGGFGALREGMVVPEVQGIDPSIEGTRREPGER